MQFSSSSKRKNILPERKIHLWVAKISHNFPSLKSKGKKLVGQSSSLLQEVANKNTQRNCWQKRSRKRQREHATLRGHSLLKKKINCHEMHES